MIDDAGWFAWIHFWVPLLTWLLVVSMVAALDIDWHLSHALFAREGYRWFLRDTLVTETLVHRGGHLLSIAAWTGTLAAWLSIRRRNPALARPMARLLLSILLSTLLVSWIKSWSNMDCPWDIQGLGGVRPNLSLLEWRPHGLPQGRCFPAGHASGGYAWLALYFFLLAVRPAWRRYGLGAGIGLGALYGITQQLRGAHFLSHDLWTIAICWSVAYALRDRRAMPRITASPTSTSTQGDSRNPVPHADASPAVALRAARRSCGMQ